MHYWGNGVLSKRQLLLTRRNVSHVRDMAVRYGDAIMLYINQAQPLIDISHQAW